MKIELFLKKINQEMIATINKSAAGCDYYASWPKECCILDFHRPARDSGDYMVRKEDVGGMLWSYRSGAVYKLDEEAYHTLLELDHGLDVKLVARKMRTTPQRVNAFVKQMKVLGLA